jgi:hypothetical protein
MDNYLPMALIIVLSVNLVLFLGQAAITDLSVRVGGSGQEFYNALKRQGCLVKMVIYPRTPHGIEEPKLLLDCMNRNLEWFDRHVRGRGSGAGRTRGSRCPAGRPGRHLRLCRAVPGRVHHRVGSRVGPVRDKQHRRTAHGRDAA